MFSWLQRKRYVSGLFTFSCLLSLLFHQASPAVAQAADAQWTILVYLAADNDLEPYMLADFLEMQSVGSSDEINIVVQLDRAEGYEELYGDWTETKRYLVQPNGVVKPSTSDFAVKVENVITAVENESPAGIGLSLAEYVELASALLAGDQETADSWAQSSMATTAPFVTEPDTYLINQRAVESLGETESGDPQTLADFIAWGVTSYPAQHYMLIISNHGGGWTGVANDESADGDGLTLPELGEGLAAGLAETEQEKFDLIAFDACLMAQLETAWAVAPYADYLLASQELEPGQGWDHYSNLRQLSETPDMDAVALGKTIINNYINYFLAVPDYATDDVTLSLMDLGQLEQLQASISQLDEQIGHDPEAWIKLLVRARRNVTQFNQGSSAVEIDQMASIDLHDFTRRLLEQIDAQEQPDPALRQAVQDVTSAIEDFVLYNGKGLTFPDAEGLSIFFPRLPSLYEAQKEEYIGAIAPEMEAWQGFLDTLHSTLTEVYGNATLDIQASNEAAQGELPDANIHDPALTILDISGEGISDLTVQVLRLIEATEDDPENPNIGNYEMVAELPLTDEEPGEGEWQEQHVWDAWAPVVTDGETSTPVFLEKTAYEKGKAVIKGALIPARNPDQQLKATLIFDLENGKLLSARVLVDPNAGFAPREMRLRRGDQFIPYQRIVALDDEAGMTVADGLNENSVVLTYGSEGLLLQLEPAPAGLYVLHYVLENYAGVSAQTQVELAVDNEGLDDALQGIKEGRLGLTSLLPSSFYFYLLPDELVEQGAVGVQFYDEETTINLAGFAMSTSAQQFVDEQLASLAVMEGVEIGEGAEAALAEQPATRQEYRWTDEDGIVYQGVFYWFCVADNERCYALDFYAPEESTDGLVEALNIFREYLVFVPPVLSAE